MSNEAWMDGILNTAAAEGRQRHVRTRQQTDGKLTLDGRPVVNLSSNDYLNLARHPRVVEGARQALAAWGAGAGASRLVTGSLECHAQLEQRLAAFKNRPAALVFGSGYLANLGTIPALVGREDTVYADRLIHASLLDGIALSHARLVRFRHNDAGHLAEHLARGRKGRALVIVESVYSMDGDLAPLADITALTRHHEAMLMVDEAHATGIFGPRGGGCVNAAGLTNDVPIAMGTLSKALGGYGGFIAGSETLRALLIQQARAFIYTTAPPPATIGAALGALDVLEADPALGARLLARAHGFRNALQAAGLDTMNSASQIIPLRVGDSGQALALAARLETQGILAVAIRPPTVPPGSARLRLSVTLALEPDTLERAATTIADAARALGVIP